MSFKKHPSVRFVRISYEISWTFGAVGKDMKKDLSFLPDNVTLGSIEESDTDISLFFLEEQREEA